MYCNLEDVLVKGVARDDISKQLHDISKLYTEIDISKLEVQLSNMSSHFKTNNITVSLDRCLQYLTSLSPVMRVFYSEVYILVRIIMVMPATNAASERSFSVMRRLKSYLRSTMGQSHLNHIMLLNIYEEKLDTLELKAVDNEFVRGSEHRLRFLENFKHTPVIIHFVHTLSLCITLCIHVFINFKTSITYIIIHTIYLHFVLFVNVVFYPYFII